MMYMTKIKLNYASILAISLVFFSFFPLSTSSKAGSMDLAAVDITNVSWSGGSFGSWGIKIQVKCTWSRMYSSHWGEWLSDAAYDDVRGESSYISGSYYSGSSGSSSSGFSSSQCFGTWRFMVKFYIRKYGIWFGSHPYEGSIYMGVRYYDPPQEFSDLEITYTSGGKSVTVRYDIINQY